MNLSKTILLIIVIQLFSGCGMFKRDKSEETENDKANKTEAHKPGQTYKIGDRGTGGGRIFYDKGECSDGWRYLEVAPGSQGNSGWGCYEVSVPEARETGIGKGRSNTEAIVRTCKEDDFAAKIAYHYQGGGKRDWFLPYEG